MQNRRFYTHNENLSFIVGCTANKNAVHQGNYNSFCICYKKSCIAQKIEFFKKYLVFSILPKKRKEKFDITTITYLSKKVCRFANP